jgi:hypothetical protein
LLVEKCNRCRKDTPYSYYKFNIEEKSISGSKWSDLCTPETRLDDFHLCPICMNKFIEFIKEGKKQ